MKTIYGLTPGGNDKPRCLYIWEDPRGGLIVSVEKPSSPHGWAIWIRDVAVNDLREALVNPGPSGEVL
jgi:hypothetical protein